MKTLNDYTIVLSPETNGTFVAHIPAIPGCHAWGSTAQEAREELNAVFSMICEEYIEENESLPNNLELVIAHAS